ncbi:hypothetical protein [Altibacter sp. HG106]|uniref:hypothetical protein n=1 Tax=Altibacter sp. HG106 TaxID=3023937 RepID=UPI002350BE48|nr:hypothetical protein [Altibacter sp. HG106]MDC7993557.1 hypothetical protein [Altibacter sp. HG106]
MTIKKIIEWDRKAFQKLRNFQLPHYCKRLGLFLFLAVIAVMFSLKYTEAEPMWLRNLLRNLLLIGLLMISISKERVEDEMMGALRAQSYAIAFVMGVLYALIQPYVDYLVALVLDPTDATLDMSYFQVLAFMLLVQIMFFRVMLKKCTV